MAGNNTKVSEDEKDRAEQAFAALLASLPPELAAKVKDKYEEDSSRFRSYLQQQTPSQDPKYWAKPSCNKCHGKGTLGTLSVFAKESPAAKIGSYYTNVQTTYEVQCRCALKNYSKWLSATRIAFNASKHATAAEGEQNAIEK